MSEWAETALGEVLTLTKRPVAVAEVDEVPWAGARWYAEGIYARPVADAAEVKTRNLNRLERDDITYNRMWATKAAFGVAGADVDGCLVTGDFPIFVADRSRLLPAFMKTVFQTDSFQRGASVRAVGTTERRRLKEADFLAMTLALPPLAEQRRIVDVVAAVDAQIEALRVEQVSATENTRRARLALLSVGVQRAWQSELTDSHTSLGWTETVPAGWRRETIGSVATVRSGATPRRSEQARYFDNGSIPWVKTGDLNERTIHATPESITEAGFAESSVRLLPVDTVLVAMYGGFGQIGRTARLGVDSTTNQAISALTELRDDVLPAYLHQALKAGRPKWRLVAASSRKDPNISKRDVENFDFPLPSLDEQHEIVFLLEGAEMTADAAESELTRLRMFRSALLTSLLNQDIEIPESYDALLEAAS